MSFFLTFLIWSVFIFFKVLIFHSYYRNSTQECFKAAWSSHKSVHVKAQLSSIATGDQNSDLISQGWLYCVKKGQARTLKLPHFDWIGFVTKISSNCYLLIRCNVFILLLFSYIFLRFCRPLKQYPISTKRVVPAEIEKPDWAIDVSAVTFCDLNLFFCCTSISLLAKLNSS